MNLFSELRSDIRFIEGLNNCINCGVCTAICPAAAVYDYDPRVIMDIVQGGDEAELERLLKSDTIWYCGECLSCKTRCPRGNAPGYIIQSLRALSIRSGLYMESKEGPKQLALKRTVGDHILKYGYCVYIDEVDTGLYPEQGPVWEWFRQNREEVLKRLGASYRQDRSGTLRQIPRESLEDLKKLFDATGATESFEKMEIAAFLKADELNIEFKQNGKDAYFEYLYNGEEKE